MSLESIMEKKIKLGKILILSRAKSLRSYTKSTKRWNSRAQFNCICDCGIKCIYTGQKIRRFLREDKKLQCQTCAFKDRPQSKKIYADGWRAYRLLIVNRCSKSKGRIKNYLSFDDWLEIVSKNCFYCGNLPALIPYVRSDTFYANGVDRVDSGKHYSKDNCVSCCKWCNRAKQSMSVLEFKEMIFRIYKVFLTKE